MYTKLLFYVNSCHDAESVTSDLSDPSEVCGGGVNSSIRRYNQLGGGSNDMCDSSDCDISTTCTNLVPASRLQVSHCDTSSPSSSTFACLEKNQLNDPLRQEKNLRLDAVRSGRCDPCDSVYSLNSIPHSSLMKLEDIMKESKTSNVNVLVKDNPANNELLFDSEKYAKYEKSRLKNSVNNLSKSGTKRVKEVNLLHEKRGCQSMVLEGELEGEFCEEDVEDRGGLAINKRMRLDEKNVQYELEKCQVATVERTADSASSTLGNELHMAPTPSVSSDEQRQANLTWRSFVGDAKSAVVDTFYGQFKSSVCSDVLVMPNMDVFFYS